MDSEKEDRAVTVTCKYQPQPHSVTGLGLQLLARTARPGHGHSIHRLRVRDLHGPDVASLLREPVVQLEVTGGIDCRTEASRVVGVKLSPQGNRKFPPKFTGTKGHAILNRANAYRSQYPVTTRMD